MALFPSEEWISRYRDLINGSEEYREAAQTWEGDIAFFMEAEPDRGVPRTSSPGSTCGTGNAAARG